MYTKKDLRKFQTQAEFAHKMGDTIKEKHLEKKVEEIKKYLHSVEKAELKTKLQKNSAGDQNRINRIKAHSWQYQKNQLLQAGITPIWYTYKVTFYSDNKEQIKELYYKLKNGMECINSYTGKYGGITYDSIISEYNLNPEELNDAGYIDNVEDFSRESELSDEAKQKLIIEAIMNGRKSEYIHRTENVFTGKSFYTIQKVIQESFLEIWDEFLKKEYPDVSYTFEK